MNPDLAEIPAGKNTTSAEHTERQSSAWDFRNVYKNYIWLIAFQVGSSVCAFAAVWLITKRVGSDGQGAVFAVIAASQTAQIFVNWTTVALVRYGVDEFVETAAIARTFWSRAIILVVNLAFLLALASFWFPLLADTLKLSADTFWLVMAHFTVMAMWLHVQMGMQAAKRLREQGMLQMFERLIILTGVGALFAGQILDIRLAVICYIAGPAVMTVVGIVLLRTVIFTRFSLDVAIVKRTLIYSLPLLPYWLIGYLTGSYIDAAFITKFLSRSALGVYSIATQINGVTSQLPTIANTILFPLLITQQAESSGERSFFYFRHILPGLVLAWGVFCALLAFGGYVMIPLVFAPEFGGAALPTWILLASSVFWIPIAVGYAAYANAISATYISLIAACFSAVANIGANFYLIPRYGLAGCAWATLAAYAVSAVIFSTLLRRSSDIPYSWTFLAFLPSLIGVVLISYYEMPLWALLGCIAASLVIAIYRRHSMNELYGFISGFWRTN